MTCLRNRFLKGGNCRLPPALPWLDPVMRLTSTLLLGGTFLFLVSPLCAQDPPRDSLLMWMDHIAQHQLDERDAAVAAVQSVSDAEQRQKVVREKAMAAMGGLPDYHGPLNARVTGHIQADGYVIDKVIFESLPHFYVTANLYRPNRPGRYPGVLLQSGHVAEGKPESQRVAANLALKGFVVFAFDPIGQGEREQSYSELEQSSLAGGATNEHIQLEAQGLLIGQGWRATSSGTPCGRSITCKAGRTWMAPGWAPWVVPVVGRPPRGLARSIRESRRSPPPARPTRID